MEFTTISLIWARVHKCTQTHIHTSIPRYTNGVSKSASNLRAKKLNFRQTQQQLLKLEKEEIICLKRVARKDRGKFRKKNMKTSDVLQAFHGMPACDRVDLLCRMLHYCVPYEAHFLGTVLVDTSREHYKSFVSKAEVGANRVNYYSTFKDIGLTHEVCEKLCCALAVVHADNHPVAEVVFNLLNDKKVLKQLGEMNDVKVMQDFRLLYVMCVHHPAFTFNQRQLLLYTYLQQMDTMFAEKAKFGFSLSNSMEVGSCCVVRVRM